MKAYQILLHGYDWHIIPRAQLNEFIQQQIDVLAGRQEFLLSTVKRRKISWFGHVCKYDMLPKTKLQTTVKGGRIAAEDRPHKS